MPSRYGIQPDIKDIPTDRCAEYPGFYDMCESCEYSHQLFTWSWRNCIHAKLMRNGSNHGAGEGSRNPKGVAACIYSAEADMILSRMLLSWQNELAAGRGERDEVHTRRLRKDEKADKAALEDRATGLLTGDSTKVTQAPLVF